MQVVVAPSEQVVIVLFVVAVGSETKFINRAVKRNPERFPKDFVITLTDKEWHDLRFQIGTLKEIAGQSKHRKSLANFTRKK